MNTVKIRSNPYKKEVSFFSLNENNEWYDIKDDNRDGKLREMSSDKMFLPFRIKEIIDIISNEYYVPGGDKVKVIFEGTEDEYEEVLAVCSDEDIADKVILERSAELLDDARDILKNIKEIFFNVNPILAGIIGEDSIVKSNLNKVVDALDDIIPICVFGNYSAGKSTFINALIGNDILPSGGDPVTAKIYKLSPSMQEDRIIIDFQYKDEEYELRFDNNGYKIIKGSNNNELIDMINDTIDKIESKELLAMANMALSIINSFEKKNKEDSVIGDMISIEVPFNKNGVIGQSNNRFVIFDTPGSNSNSNKDHGAVLKKAMEGFSNGIPIWVSQYDSIDTKDNAELCDNIYAIDALDKRFTMIVINKADTAELPEDGWNDEDINNIMEYESIEKMYSSGIYFVSSVMGLGSKNNAKFISKYLRKTFKEKKETFSDPEDEEFYQTLYKYNIMPSQIKENAIIYSLENNNLIYANSGLYCVEKEVETFASKYSSYNKCQMVYSFLDSIKDYSNQRIDKRKEMLNKYKIEEQNNLNVKQIELKDCIDKESKIMEIDFEKSSKVYVKDYVKSNLQFSQTVSEINSLDEKYTNANASEHHFSTFEKDYENSNDKKWNNLKKNIQGFTKGKVNFKEIINTYISDNEEVKITKDSLDYTKKEIDMATSDTLINIVRDSYRDNMMRAKTIIDDFTKEYWLENVEKFKKQLTSIITESNALTLEERNEISSIIMNYEPVSFDDEADDIFIKAKFLRGFSEKLNNKKLVDKYNSKISKNIMELAIYRNDKCKESFYQWEQKLRDVIDQNITEYNPELSSIASNIALLSDDIRKLEKEQNAIQESFETIGNMIDWKTFDEGEGC